MPRRAGQERFALLKPLGAVPLLLLQLVQPLFRQRELSGGVAGGQGSEGRQRGHFAHRRQVEEAHLRVSLQRGDGLFVGAVDVDVPALAAQLPQLGGGEVPPLRQPLRRCTGGGLLRLQRFPALYALVHIAKERLERVAGQGGRLLRHMGVFLQHRRHPRQGGEAFQILPVGVRLLGEVDDAQLPQTLQQRVLLRGGGDNVDDLHFLDHRLTPCSFFLAILPRTTAAVCWSPR